MSDKMNLREYNNKEQLLFPTSVGDYLKDNDLAHVVDEAVEQMDMSAYYQKVSPVGNPAYHPKMMLKIWFYGYAVKTITSRKIEDKLYKDIGFIFLAGMQKPDFKAISEFRKNNSKELRVSFVEIVRICHQLGMTQLGTIALDSKVMRANSAKESMHNESELKEEQANIERAVNDYLERAHKADEAEDALYGPDKRGDELPDDINTKEKRLKKIKEALEKIRATKEKVKEHKDIRVSTTDTDALYKCDKNRNIIPGYRGEIAVDSKEQVIVANDVTDDYLDYGQTVPMTDAILENISTITDKQKPEPETKINLLADSLYGSGENLSELKKRKNIEPYIPDAQYTAKERGHNESGFHATDFIFDKEQNSYSCPAGSSLRFLRKMNSNGKPYLLYRCDDCSRCKHFGVCTTDPRGRSLKVTTHIALLRDMREKLSKEESRKIYALRKITVEPVIGNMSKNLGLKEFLLRGLGRVKGEYALMCSAHNLWKISRFVKKSSMTLKELLEITAKPIANTS